MSFYTSLTGINSALNRFDVSSNNIANVQTDTYKRSIVTFQDIYSIQPRQLVQNTTGQGSSVAAIKQQFSQGALLSTGNTLDVAISGDGFYIMQDKNSKGFYSRSGQFLLNENGYIVNSDGEKLMGSKGIASPNSHSYTLEPIKIQNKTIGQSKPTTEIEIGINLPANDKIISLPFDPRDDKTYSRKNIITIYDSSGNPRDATIYYVKKSNPTEKSPYIEWDTHLYVDGKKVDLPIKPPIFEKNEKYIEWQGEGFASENFEWQEDDAPNINAKETSIVDGKVYQGNGSSAKIIGIVDSINNGKNGRPLRINFIDQVKPINQLVQNGVGIKMDSGLKPIGFIPEGSENVKIFIDSFTEDDDIQLFLGDGTHLLGTSIIGNDADISWEKNGVKTKEDLNSKVIKEEYGFNFNSVYDGSTPLVSRANSQPYVDNPDKGIEVSVNGMKIKYTGDGDRVLEEDKINDGLVENTFEGVSIDKVTEPTFLMVSGSGVFGVMVSWDKMPNLTDTELNIDSIKDKIKHKGSESIIQFPIDGSRIIKGDPKSYPGFYLDDGSYISDLRIKFDPSTGYGGDYKTIINKQNGKPEGDLSKIDITSNGLVNAYYENGYSENVATIILAKFNNPHRLIQIGDTKYLESTNAGVVASNRAGYGGLGVLKTGSIEQSNVDITSELADLIEAQRNFQSNSKAIETTDKMTKSMIDNLR